MKKFIICLVFSIAIMGCSNDEESFVNVQEMIEQNLCPIELKAVDDLPELLVEYIQDYEKTKDSIEYKNDGIYMFSWRGGIYYFHWHPYANVWFEIIFNSNGSRLINLTPEDRMDIKENSKDWKLIYRIK